MTIASTCMKVFRKNFLREEEIGIIPPGGYRYKDNHSHKALQWLVWMERELGHPIIHAGRGREYRIAGTPVDGYYEVESENQTSRYVLQFHGCVWHEEMSRSNFDFNFKQEIVKYCRNDR